MMYTLKETNTPLLSHIPGSVAYNTLPSLPGVYPIFAQVMFHKRHMSQMSQPTQIVNMKEKIMSQMSQSLKITPYHIAFGVKQVRQLIDSYGIIKLVKCLSAILYRHMFFAFSTLM